MQFILKTQPIEALRQSWLDNLRASCTMMPKPNYSQKANEILDAAEVRMRRGGFGAVSYRDLAADVGIKGSSVHYHFPQKADLGRAVVERYTDRLLEFLDAPDRPEESVEVRIGRLCLGYQNALNHDKVPCLCCVLGAASLDLPPVVSEAVKQFYQQLIDWTTIALGDRPDAATLAKHIIGTLQGTMITALALNQPALLAEATPYLLQLVRQENG